MVHKCSAFGCKSGYKGNADDSSVTFHCYPSDPQLREKWIRANPRKDFVPTKHSRLCSLHFQPSDFVAVRSDSNTHRAKHKSETLVKRYLKEGVVPSLFPNTPSYLSQSPAAARTSTKASSSSRRALEASQLAELEASFTENDDISTLSCAEVLAKLQSEAVVPTGFSFTVLNDSLLVYVLQGNADIPTVTAGIVLKPDMTVVCSVEDKLVPASQYSDLVEGSINRLSQLVNLMARVKSWSTDPTSASLSFHVQTAVTALETALDNLPDRESEEHRKITFIVEQLRLLTKNKYGRHYSPQLTILGFLLHAASSAAYSVLLEENVLCLPSTRTLKKVTRRLNCPSTSDNCAYLKLRVTKLNEFERTVLLIVDEIYSAKRVEYSGGDVLGLTADGNVASTLLCFMVKSLAGKYKDIVALYPMDRLTAAKQHACYQEVMTTLHSTALNVVAVSVDNAATNRKFYIDFLCDGTLKTQVVDSVTDQPMFLIFDPVHTIKNVYNNFQRRKVFQCPSLAHNLPDGCSADFNHVVALYTHESTMALKKAHKLSPATLNPRSIEKTSVKLAVSVFCESTRDALQFYAAHEGRSAWSATADFISLILKLWNVLNVKTSSKGKHKRDYTQDPVRSSLDWKLTFLREFAAFVKRWEESAKPGLSKETFLALRHTCEALADCASFLLDRRGFRYVLLGHLQSDAIESRFGWLRQLAGANYYISMRQVVEGDKKIKAVSLLKFSKLSLADIDSALVESAESQSSASSDDSLASSIAESINYSHWPSANDANVIFYVSGAIARSAARATKCDSCRQLLINADDELEPLEMDATLDYSSTAFLNSVNRGGLARPTDYTFLLCVHCWRVFEDIRASTELKKQFLGAGCHRALFYKVIDRLTTSEMYGQEVVGDNYCTAGHDLKLLLVNRFFNCVAQNLVKELTRKADDHGPQSRSRKIAKLQSETHT